MSIEATYCPEDNKIRLYSGRVDRETYERLREAGYKSTPKQSCDFVAAWSLEAEDIALELIEDGDEIGDEDQSPEDRAADRAERFAMYRDNRRRESTSHADAFDAGPSTYGHQNAQRAERMARRHDRHRTGAVSQWSKAEYWQTRTAGVIRNAMYKSDARTRRGRLLRLEADLRRAEGSLSRCYHCSENGARALRVAEHLRNRVAYERVMLEAEGGTATDAEIIPGGYFGRYQVIRVHKSPETKAPVSVSVLAPYPYHRGEGPAPLTLQKLNIQRMSESAYTPPTDADLAKLAEALATLRAKTQAKNASNPKLINPTDEDAERLQELLNRRAAARKRDYYTDAPPAPQSVLRLTQKQYTANSGGTYSRLNAEYLRDNGTTHKMKHSHTYDRSEPTVNLCKLRIGPSVGDSFYLADRVIIITDKPQKPILGLDTIEANIKAKEAEAVK